MICATWKGDASDGCNRRLLLRYAGSECTTSPDSAGLVERADLAGGVPESDGLCSILDDGGSFTTARPAGKTCSLAVLSHPYCGAACLRHDRVALEEKPGLARVWVSIDGAGNVTPSRRLVHHHCQRDFRGDCPGVVGEGLGRRAVEAN